MKTRQSYSPSSLFSLILILAAGLMTGCSRGYGCYYSDSYVEKQIPVENATAHILPRITQCDVAIN